jgi:hypothetical protein
MIDEIRNEGKKRGNEVKILIGATISDLNSTIKKKSDGMVGGWSIGQTDKNFPLYVASVTNQYMVNNYKAATNSYQTIKPFQSSFT